MQKKLGIILLLTAIPSMIWEQDVTALIFMSMIALPLIFCKGEWLD